MSKCSERAVNVWEANGKNLLRRVRVCTRRYVAVPTDIDKSMTSGTHRRLQSRTNECGVIHCLGVERRLPASHAKDGMCAECV